MVRVSQTHAKQENTRHVTVLCGGEEFNEKSVVSENVVWQTRKKSATRRQTMA